MADLLGIELARPGEWDLTSGPVTVTAQMLHDAARFAQRAGARPSPVKLGHGDPRFNGDGEPALGWLANLRVDGSDDEAVLLGDITGLPEWLAAAVPQHWPDRSIEGWQDYEVDGEKYGLVIDGLALLGVTPPGMSNIRSLRDLPQALGVAASARIVASFVAASSDPAKPYGDVTYADPGYQKDGVKRYPLDTEAHCRAAWSYINQAGNAAKYTPEQLARIKSKIKTALKRYGVEVSAAAPPDPPIDPPEAPATAGASPSPSTAAEAARRIHAASTRTEEGAGRMDPAKIREALGLSADASDDEVKAALTSAGLVAAPPSEPPAPESAPEPQPTPKPELVHASGTITIDASAWTEREDRIKRLEAADAKRRRDERDQVLATAVTEGKFPPARKEHWVRLWDADPEGTRQVIASLAKNVVPVAELGYADADGESIDDEFKHLFPPSYSGKGA